MESGPAWAGAVGANILPASARTRYADAPLADRPGPVQSGFDRACQNKRVTGCRKIWAAQLCRINAAIFTDAKCAKQRLKQLGRDARESAASCRSTGPLVERDGKRPPGTGAKNCVPTEQTKTGLLNQGVFNVVNRGLRAFEMLAARRAVFNAADAGGNSGQFWPAGLHLGFEPGPGRSWVSAGAAPAPPSCNSLSAFRVQ